MIPAWNPAEKSLLVALVLAVAVACRDRAAATEVRCGPRVVAGQRAVAVLESVVRGLDAVLLGDQVADPRARDQLLALQHAAEQQADDDQDDGDLDEGEAALS